MNELKNQYIIFHAAEVLLKKKIFILVFVFFFSALGALYTYTDSEEDIQFDLTTSFLTNITQNIKIDYIKSALILMTSTKLNIMQNQIDENNNFEKIHDAMSMTKKMENLSLDLGKEIILMQHLDFPDMNLNLFPTISLKTSENIDTYELFDINFSFVEGTVEQGKETSRKIIEKTLEKINNEIRIILDSYISFYLFKYDIFQTTKIDNNIQINEQLKHRIIMHLINIIGYNKHDFNVLEIIYSNFSLNEEINYKISQIRIILATGFLGFLLSIFIILIMTSYKEYKHIN